MRSGAHQSTSLVSVRNVDSQLMELKKRTLDVFEAFGGGRGWNSVKAW